MSAEPLTVLHVDAERGFSGGEVQVFLLLEGLRERGHRPVLACPPGSRSAEEARGRGLEVREVAMRSDVDLAAVRGLARVLRELRPDLAHLHTGRATWLGGLAAWRAGVPAIATRRMDRPVKRNLRNRWIYGRLVQRVAAISPAVVDVLVAGGVDPERIDLVWSTVDPARLVPARDRGATRAELGAAPDDVLVLGLGALFRRKGFDVLLEAVAHLAAGDPPLAPPVVIAGDGPERADLEARARELGPGRVRFLGRREDVADLLAACDVFVLPSRAEGLGVAALEAMASGRPVVASRVGGLGQAVEDGRSGLLVPAEDPAALAGALRRLVLDPALRRSLGRGGTERVRDGFLPERMVRSYESLYRSVLSSWRSR